MKEISLRCAWGTDKSYFSACLLAVECWLWGCIQAFDYYSRERKSVEDFMKYYETWICNDHPARRMYREAVRLDEENELANWTNQRDKCWQQDALIWKGTCCLVYHPEAVSWNPPDGKGDRLLNVVLWPPQVCNASHNQKKKQ